MWKLWPQRSTVIEAIFYSLGFLAIYFPALIGLFITSNRKFLKESEKGKSYLYFTIGLVVVLVFVSAVFWPIGRFRYPADVLILPFAAYVISNILGGRRTSQVAAFLVGLTRKSARR